MRGLIKKQKRLRLQNKLKLIQKMTGIRYYPIQTRDRTYEFIVLWSYPADKTYAKIDNINRTAMLLTGVK